MASKKHKNNKQCRAKIWKYGKKARKPRKQQRKLSIIHYPIICKLLVLTSQYLAVFGSKGLPFLNAFF